jgi:hypothetical protein
MTADYHSDTDYISRSDLAVFATSRRQFKRRRDANIKDDDKDVLRIGKGTHAVALKDAIELNKIVLIPDSALSRSGRRSGNDWTRFRLKTENRGKTLLLPKQWELCQQIADSLQKIDIAETADGRKLNLEHLLADPRAERECEHRWADILPCRLKADLVLELPDSVLCIDLKTAFSVDERKFWKEVRDRKLWLQVAHYSAGLENKFGKPVRFIFVAIEKTGYHDADIFELDSEAVQIAKRGRLMLLEQLKECLETGAFIDPPKAEGIKMLSLTAADMGIDI